MASGATCKLFIGGISAQTTTEVLRGHFSRYGRIVDAVVMSKNGRPRGFGFVTYDSPGPAIMALAEQQWLDGRLVDVKRAVPGEHTQERFSNKIFVGGLPQDVNTDDLKRYFSSYGAVADAVVMVDRRTNRSRGFGFVRFVNGLQGSAASEAVLLNFANHRLSGKWVEVKPATPAALLQAFMEQQMGMCVLDSFGSHPRGRRGRRRKQRFADPSMGCVIDWNYTVPADLAGCLVAQSLGSWPGTPTGVSISPMKVAFHDGAESFLSEERFEGFTREEFLSLEVRPWLSAW